MARSWTLRGKKLDPNCDVQLWGLAEQLPKCGPHCKALAELAVERFHKHFPLPPPPLGVQGRSVVPDATRHSPSIDLLRAMAAHYHGHAVNLLKASVSRALDASLPGADAEDVATNQAGRLVVAVRVDVCGCDHEAVDHTPR